MLEVADVKIRAMVKEDLNCMVRWLNNDQVLAFYEEPPSDLQRVTDKYGPRIAGEHYVTPCIVEYNNKAIGYMQYYRIQAADLEQYQLSKSEIIYGIDQFIGEPQLWGRGIGSLMIGLMLEELSKNKDASSVILDVKKSNKRAISSYSKCGFKAIKELEKDSILMEWLSENNG